MTDTKPSWAEQLASEIYNRVSLGNWGKVDIRARIEFFAESRATEAIAVFMLEHGIATGHGDTANDLLSELLAATEAKARRAAIEECISFIQGGRFLHDDAPPARFAKEVVLGLRCHFGSALADKPAASKEIAA